MRRPGIEPEGDVLTHSVHCARLPGLNSRQGDRTASNRLATPAGRSAGCVEERCAGRESNPGYELGKLMSYHWTTGARFRVSEERTKT
jgi:hypothetical protein